jgi:DNA-binding GntR family transcriptional regulator
MRKSGSSAAAFTVGSNLRLDTSSVQERLAGELRRLIISGKFEPGERVSEHTLAESFGVSRTPVREALKQLQVEGLVDIVPRVGTFVARPSAREIAELFALKEILEGLAARLVAQARPQQVLERLTDNLAQSRAAVAAEDAGRYAQLVHEFHELIIEGGDSGKLVAHYGMLMNQLAYHRLVRMTLSRPGRLERSLEEHARILAAIEAGDGYAAEFQMRDHVSASHRELAASTWQAP